MPGKNKEYKGLNNNGQRIAKVWNGEYRNGRLSQFN